MRKAEENHRRTEEQHKKTIGNHKNDVRQTIGIHKKNREKSQKNRGTT